MRDKRGGSAVLYNFKSKCLNLTHSFIPYNYTYTHTHTHTHPQTHTHKHTHTHTYIHTHFTLNLNRNPPPPRAYSSPSLYLIPTYNQYPIPISQKSRTKKCDSKIFFQGTILQNIKDIGQIDL